MTTEMESSPITFQEIGQEEAEAILPDFFSPDHPRWLRHAYVAQAEGCEDRILVFASLGAIAKHVLVCPENGEYSVANLPEKTRHATIAVANVLREKLKLRGKPLLVEHGAAATTQSKVSAAGGHIGCACIEFPHIHLINFRSDWKMAFYAMCVEIGGQPIAIDSDEKFASLSGKPYLLVSPWPNGWYAWQNPHDKFGRQFIRKAVWHLFATGGDVDRTMALIRNDPSQQWDWRVNPGFETVRETDRLLARFSTPDAPRPFDPAFHASQMFGARIRG